MASDITVMKVAHYSSRLDNRGNYLLFRTKLEQTTDTEYCNRAQLRLNFE